MKKHLASRGMLHKDVIITEQHCTVLLWNLSGQLTGYQVYTPNAPKQAKIPRDARYFTKGKGIWGLQYLNSALTTLYVVEGIFDAVKLHNLGQNAIAMLGSTPNPLLKNWLNSLQYKTVAICDGDAAGIKLAAFTDTQICLPEKEDLGSLPYSTITKLLNL